MEQKMIEAKTMETASSPIATPATSSSSSSSSNCEFRDASVETSSIGVATDPDCLGPCEPGTSVVLEGIVWNETENGILVVNVTWRGKTYVGTLMDATRHDWAPPRFNCDSPASEHESVRTPRGRGKRGRAPIPAPVNDPPPGERRLRRRKGNNNPFAAPPSPARSEAGNANKRRSGRVTEQDVIEPPAKRPRNGNAKNPAPNASGLIECPEPNCNKKYRHINGLRYHQTHAHRNTSSGDSNTEVDTKEEKMDTTESPGEVSSPVKGKGGRKSSSSNNSQGDSDSKSSADTAVDAVKSKRNGESKKSEAKSHTKTDKVDKQATVALTQVNLEKAKKSVSSASSSIYQVALSSSSCISTVASSTGTQVTSVATSPAVSVTMTTSSDSDKTSHKKSKNDKEKKSGGKAVGPRPLAAAPGVTSTLPSVTMHAQVSLAASGSVAGLKAIQPRPTVMGDTTVNPALVGLKDMKEKKSKKKKKDKDKEKDKDKSHKDTGSHGNKGQDKTAANGPANATANASNGKKADMSVIKSVQGPVATTGKVSDAGAAGRTVAAPPELQKQTSAAPQGAELDKQTRSPPELQKQVFPTTTGKVDSPSKPGTTGLATSDASGRPPSSLSLNSPMRYGNENKDHQGDVQSPAYSDISDAGDSNATLEAEPAAPPSTNTPKSAKEPEKQESSKHQPSVAAKTPSQPGMSQQTQQYPNNMYSGYYRQNQYMPPGHPNSSSGPQGSNAPSAAQGAPPPQSAAEGKGSHLPKENGPVPKSNMSKDPKSSPAPNNPQVKDGKGMPMPPGGTPTPEQMKEYQERMMLYGAHYQQYYGYSGQDPAYHMHYMSTNPEYKAQYEKWIQDQERRRREYMVHQKSAVSGSAKNGPGAPLDLNTKAIDLSKQGKPSPGSKVHPSSSSGGPRDGLGSMPPKEDSSNKPSSAAGKDSGPKEKHNENHQILKENIEIKNQYMMYEKHQQEEANMRRYYMLAQHKAMEQQHRYSMGGPSPKDGGDARMKMNGNPNEGHHKTGMDASSTPGKLPSDHHHRAMLGAEGKNKDMDPMKDNKSQGSIPPSPVGTPKPRDPRDPRDIRDPRDPREIREGPRESPRDSRDPRDARDPRDPRDNREGGPSNSNAQMNYAQYYGHYGSPHGYDPGQMFQNPVIGYASAYPGYSPQQMRGYPPGALPSPSGSTDSKQDMKISKMNSAAPSPGGSMPPEGKALDLLQQRAASLYNGSPQQPKVLDLKETAHKETSLGSPAKERPSRPESQGSVGSVTKGGLDRNTKSPPTQRHVHTHHHTHVVGSAYSLYGAPYGGARKSASMITSPQSSNSSSNSNGSTSGTSFTPK